MGELSLVVACGKNGEIGAGGGLPWPHITEDMGRFVRCTADKVVVMGRKTWASLPPYNRPLHGRLNLIMTRDPAGFYRDHPRFESNALAVIDPMQTLFVAGDRDLCVIGGAVIYAIFLPLATKVFLTRIDAEYPAADTIMPGWPFDPDLWHEEIDPRGNKSSDPRVTFSTLTRKP